MPWKARRLEPVERDNATLRTTIVQLRHELRTKQTALSSLELALRERSERIDALNARLEQSRAQCRRHRSAHRQGRASLHPSPFNSGPSLSHGHDAGYCIELWMLDWRSAGGD
jgi:hypothetical protein